MSTLTMDELKSDLSAARRPCVVDLEAYRQRAAEIDRRLNDVTGRVLRSMTELNATAEQTKSAILFAHLRLFKGDTPIIAASAAVKWVSGPQGAA